MSPVLAASGSQDSTDDRDKHPYPEGPPHRLNTLGNSLKSLISFPNPKPGAGTRGRFPTKFMARPNVVPRMKELKDYVTEIPDFPKEGILFRDITTVLSDPDGLRRSIDGLVDMLKDVDFDLVLGSESRGFIFGTPVAYAMNKGFILVRKKGKLPRETISEKYDLEYGTAELEIHRDAVKPGQRVVIIDDLIATGGTTEAIVRMVERLGGEVVKIGFVMELAGLRGRERLEGYDVESLIVYEGAR